ncbi:hypothetical protein LMH87_010245 [Akanthomyces muscarius]|uniref:Zn(2)-C6 fungal-type domain-containing protein n=1 Tax=Akanthomyces muscarius TaxID=2231603 RepID=A0A9W8QEL0_AKAMU|nr:hypothetical protein LMH87_010245 [Akanthomyces muscarius]KAJ4153772.1 hypothetical protein LMH87_010245 [Akanthomyces muscarius]
MLSKEQKRLSLPTGVVPRHFHGLLMTSFALPERPKSRRAKYPKVRTGCVSCKRRHVKCDEAKPNCNRCLKLSGVCGGYAPLRSKSCSPKITAESRAEDLSILELTHTTHEITSPEITTPEGGVMTPSTAAMKLATPPFLHAKLAVDYFSEQQGMIGGGDSVFERSSTSYLCHDSAPVVDDVGEIGILDGPFWTDTVPRLVRENLAIRYANLAIHTLIISKQPELTLQEVSDLGTNHYSLALVHYGVALKEMRNANPMCDGIRAAVLCSMFFVIFEALNGDREAAESHLLCGQRLLNELQHLLPSGIAASSAGSLRKELRNLLHYITMQMSICGATFWKIECDALCAEYLGEFAVDKPHDMSPKNGTLDGLDFMGWPKDSTTRLV